MFQAKGNIFNTGGAGNLLAWSRITGRNAKGRGVSVALVDSGINAWHSHVGEVSGGVSVGLEEGRLVWEEDFRDNLGHGTAIAGIIRAKAPAVHLYGVRIFQRSLNTYPTVVAAAVKWAADRGIAVINLSLGTANSRYAPILHEACEYAAGCGSIVIAAACSADFPNIPGAAVPSHTAVPGGTAFPGWPAALNCVIGVQAGTICGWNDYRFHPGSLVEFTAHGFPRPLAGRPQNLNLQGNSFATGHLTALAACLLEKHPGMDVEGLRRLLQEIWSG